MPSCVGEFDWIERIRRRAAALQSDHVLTGIGDDCAILRFDRDVLVTTDAAHEDIHFRFAWSDPADVGFRAVAAAVSDISAMGGEAAALFWSLGIPRGLDESVMDGLIDGVIQGLAAAGLALAGGNISASRSGVTLTMSVLGQRLPGGVMLRSAARPGDRIAVTGSIGASRYVLEELSGAAPSPVVTPPELAARFWRPPVRLKEGQTLVKMGVRAAIDLSDGLLQDLHHLCAASDAGARVDAERLPVDPALIRAGGDERARRCALIGGDDYELLCALPPDFDLTQWPGPAPLTVIGAFTEGDSSIMVLHHGRRRPEWETLGGHDHLKARGGPDGTT
ncbi:MAG: Thiamine-monophosphate kinase [Myxococcota bacterium]|nr:Thiamine-monophosphate kinase [Myxococcota bacterium]